jgi:hypothetical protein
LLLSASLQLLCNFFRERIEPGGFVLLNFIELLDRDTFCVELRDQSGACMKVADFNRLDSIAQTDFRRGFTGVADRLNRVQQHSVCCRAGRSV